MRASEFEYRHPTLSHQLVVAAALLTYLFDPVDIVWRFVKDSASSRTLERALFILATIAIATGAAILTRAGASARPVSSLPVESHRSLFLGDLLYALGLATLFPLSGFFILLGGETLRVYRLHQYALSSPLSIDRQPVPAPMPKPSGLENNPGPSWASAFRKEAAKWGIFLSMIAFVITLTDRLAEYLFAASFLIGTLLNAPVFRPSSPVKEPR
jgi:hypothetical protein